MAIGSKDEHNFKTRVKNGEYTFPLLVSREKAILKLVQKVVGDVTSTKEPIFSAGIFKKGNLYKKHLKAQIIKDPMRRIIHPHYIL